MNTQAARRTLQFNVDRSTLVRSVLHAAAECEDGASCYLSLGLQALDEEKTLGDYDIKETSRLLLRLSGGMHIFIKACCCAAVSLPQ